MFLNLVVFYKLYYSSLKKVSLYIPYSQVFGCLLTDLIMIAKLLKQLLLVTAKKRLDIKECAKIQIENSALFL